MDRDALRFTTGLVVGGVALLFVILTVMLVVELRAIVAVIFLGCIVGLTLGPLADYLQRYHVPRVLSVLIVYAIVMGALSLFTWYAVVEFANEFEDFSDAIADILDRYEEAAEDNFLPSVEQIQDALRENAEGIVGDAVEQAVILAQAILYLVTVFAVALMFTLTRDRLFDLVISLTPRDHQARVEELMRSLGSKLRRFLLGQFIAMTVVGVTTYIGLLIIGIRFPLVLATIAFIFEILPIVGPWIAFIPALAIALTDGFWPAVQVSILYLAIQQFESYVVVPIVYGRQVKLPALLIIVAIFIGGALMSVLGALIALPVALILHTLFFEVFVPWRRERVERSRRPDHAVF
jgi:predicted PurR-regulated permease PerM